MVAVEVAVGGELPVRAVDRGGHAIRVQLVEAERVERCTEPVEPAVEIEGGLRIERGEHGTMAFLGRELEQPAHVELAERVVAGHADQGALVVVAPCVVRAGEAARRAARFLGEPCAAVTADVQQRAHGPVVAARDDDRTAGDLEGDVLAGFAHVAAQRHQKRHTQEDLGDLAGVLFGVGVGGRRHLHRRIAHVGQACVDVGAQAFEELVEHGSSVTDAPAVARARTDDVSRLLRGPRRSVTSRR